MSSGIDHNRGLAFEVRRTIFASACLLLILIFSEVSILVALQILPFLVAQIFTGGEIYRFFKKSIEVTFIEYVAMGFSLGSLAWLLSDQLFIYLSFPKIGWLMPPVLVIISKIMKVQRQVTEPKVGAMESQTLIWIVVAALLGLSGEWVWTLPFASLTVVVLLLQRSSHLKLSKSSRNCLAISAIGVAGIITVATRPKIWWITQGDTHFYEGLTKSVSKWGWHESIFTVGYSLQYHWFAFAWSGLVTRVSGSPDWVVLTRVGPIMASLTVISFVWIISTRLTKFTNGPIVGVLIFAASSVFGEWFLIIPLAMFGSFSQLFATIWLLPVVIWVIDNQRGDHHRPFGLLMILFVGLVGGKVSHAAIAAAFLLGYQLLRIITDSRVWKIAVIESLLVISTIFVTSRILFGSSGSLSLRPVAWAPYLQGDLYNFYGRPLWVAAAILILGMTYLSLGTLIFGAPILIRNRSLYFGLVASFGSGLALSNLSSGPTSPNGLFFLHSGVILVNSILGVVLVETFHRITKSELFDTTTAVLVGCIALLCIYVIPDVDSGSNNSIWLRTSRSLVVLIPAILLTITFFLRRQSNYLRRLLVCLLVAYSTMSAVTFIAGNAAALPKDYAGFKSNGEFFLASDDLLGLSKWIKSNTADTDIYASNYSCEGLDCAEPHLSQRALLSATLERRSLIESPWIASAFTEPGSRDGAGDFAARLKYSVVFAQRPNSETLEFFKELSVRWYIVDLGKANNGLWDANSATVFANKSFVLIDIDKFDL